MKIKGTNDSALRKPIRTNQSAIHEQRQVCVALSVERGEKSEVVRLLVLVLMKLVL